MTASTSPKYLSVVETAKLLRAALKAAHPGVKFSVRSDSYAGGASIDVSYVDGPFEPAVKAITDLYSGASFDGMIDLKSYHDSLVTFEGDELPTVIHFGADFIFVRREISPAYLEQLSRAAEAELRIESGTLELRRSYAESFGGMATQYGVLPDWATGSDIVRHLSQHVAPAAG
jgi:hypothetical protein